MFYLKRENGQCCDAKNELLRVLKELENKKSFIFRLQNFIIKNLQ